MTAPPNQEIIQTYRSLYKHLLHAVQFSKPARYVARDHLRAAFRQESSSSSSSSSISSTSTSPSSTSPSTSYDPAKISKTLEFLSGATKTKGIEHKILKNLMHVWWEQSRLSSLSVRGEDLEFRKQAHEQFERTLERFNESMGTCLR